MKPLSSLPRAVARALTGLIFDLDDTVLTHGALSADAYVALNALASSGLRLVACTGRPAAWGDVLARQWPVDLAVTENGAVAFTNSRRIDRLAPAERRARRDALGTVVKQLRERFDDIAPSDDSEFRTSDFAFDIGEHASVPPPRVRDLRNAALELGARTFESSIHLHVTFDTDDKASGTLHALARCFGEDTSRALARYAFVGDSANDEPCFSAFRTTFGVSNVRRDAHRLTVVPGYVSKRERGAGFTELAELLLWLREPE
jgi:HAD superfamily hydrolase (TIGR01484 family)